MSSPEFYSPFDTSMPESALPRRRIVTFLVLTALGALIWCAVSSLWSGIVDVSFNAIRLVATGTQSFAGGSIEVSAKFEADLYKWRENIFQREDRFQTSKISVWTTNLTGEGMDNLSVQARLSAANAWISGVSSDPDSSWRVPGGVFAKCSKRSPQLPKSTHTVVVNSDHLASGIKFPATFLVTRDTEYCDAVPEIEFMIFDNDRVLASGTLKPE